MKPQWNELLADELKAPYYKDIIKKLVATEKYYPPADRILRVFKEIDYDEIKVVIIGQDPYHNEGQANGFAFAVEEDIKIPPSLKNIFIEIEIEYGEKPADRTLVSWANQGVFLLNTTLTVEPHKPASHSSIGWQIFTDSVIKLLNDRPEPIVFMLWGTHAKNKALLITNPNHYVLTAQHPSPFSCKGFFGCDHFKKANKFLKIIGSKEIQWM